MNRTLRLAATVIIAAAIAAIISMLLSGNGSGGSLPFSCDYYSAPTIATQEINSADVLLGTITTTSETTAATAPAPSAPASYTDVSPAPASDTAAAVTETTTAPTTTTTTQLAEPQSLGSLTITNEKCNVRSDAGAEFEFIKEAYRGENYEVLGTKNAANGILWMKIKLDGDRTGYVCSAFCKFDGVIPGAVAYLTFDDGPTANTPKILDILDRYNVKATFFVIYHSGQESTYKAIVDRGHTIALHSYTHDYAQIYTSQQAYFDDLEKLADYVEKVTGVRPTVIRFPGGSSNTISRKYCKGIMTTLTAEVERRGYSYFDWNVDSGDASGYKVKKSVLVDNISRSVGSGGELVVLMHDAAAKTTTVEALPEIIEIFKNRGYDLRRITNETPPVHQKVAN